jgi:hypothetical protein
MIRLTEVASQRPLRAVFTPRLLSASAIPLYVLIPAVRIPMKPAGDSDLKATTHSDLKAATIPI